AGSERVGKGNRLEIEFGRFESRAEALPALRELTRCRALKREDRLLLVADREDRAGDAIARAFAGGEFGDDVVDDIPLPGARVLRLVDQHMINAAVELVMHPAR